MKFEIKPAMNFSALMLLVASSVRIGFASRNGKPPNIIVIVADDLGYNDVSWHNPDIVSPNMERLAR